MLEREMASFVQRDLFITRRSGYRVRCRRSHIGGSRAGALRVGRKNSDEKKYPEKERDIHQTIHEVTISLPLQKIKGGNVTKKRQLQ
jgi:hypothetical protein